jgi:LppX_LprAFG lipoprotein
MRSAAIVMCLGLLVVGCGSSSDRSDLAALAASVTSQTAGKKSAHVTFALSSGPTVVTGEGGYRVDPDLAADFSISAPDGPTRFIMLDKSIYLQRPGQAWQRFAADRPEVSQLAAAMVTQADIGKQIDKLRTAGTLTATADETIEGRQATRYNIDVSVPKLIAAEPDPVLKASLTSLRDKGTSTIPYTLWVDHDNLPVRMTVAGPATATTTYTDWGTPIQVTAPI